jgi:3-hydroxyacyl-[acyl-carrier-protein] dehydratase
MPGVLQIEALAQSGGVLLMREEECKGKLAVLMGVENVKFRRPVVPGDRLYMEVTITKIRGRIGIVHAVGTVDGDVTTECEIKFALVDPEQYT